MQMMESEPACLEKHPILQAYLARFKVMKWIAYTWLNCGCVVALVSDFSVIHSFAELAWTGTLFIFEVILAMERFENGVVAIR